MTQKGTRSKWLDSHGLLRVHVLMLTRLSRCKATTRIVWGNMGLFVQRSLNV